MATSGWDGHGRNQRDGVHHPWHCAAYEPTQKNARDSERSGMVHVMAMTWQRHGYDPHKADPS